MCVCIVHGGGQWSVWNWNQFSTMHIFFIHAINVLLIHDSIELYINYTAAAPYDPNVITLLCYRTTIVLRTKDFRFFFSLSQPVRFQFSTTQHIDHLFDNQCKQTMWYIKMNRNRMMEWLTEWMHDLHHLHRSMSKQCAVRVYVLRIKITEWQMLQQRRLFMCLLSLN